MIVHLDMQNVLLNLQKLQSAMPQMKFDWQWNSINILLVQPMCNIAALRNLNRCTILYYVVEGVWDGRLKLVNRQTVWLKLKSSAVSMGESQMNNILAYVEEKYSKAGKLRLPYGEKKQ